jgi:hypothetical protein
MGIWATTMRLRHIETLRGNGTVVSNAGERVTVRYELEIYQEEAKASAPTEPRTPILGLREIVGVVLPVSFFHEHELLLEFEDGRKLTFRYLNRRGSIALSQWIG